MKRTPFEKDLKDDGPGLGLGNLHSKKPPKGLRSGTHLQKYRPKP
jgi:hypothetical protein